MYKINGVEMPIPKSFKVNIEDIDAETNRNANGDLIRDRVAIKSKIELDYPPLTQSEISTILKAVEPQFVEVEFLHPKDGLVTKTMYAGSKSAPMLIYMGKEAMWQGLSFNLIER